MRHVLLISNKPEATLSCELEEDMRPVDVFRVRPELDIDIYLNLPPRCGLVSVRGV